MLLFITASDFCCRLEPTLQTIFGWVFVKDSYFLKPCCDYVFQVSFLSISKKFKDKCDFHRVVFCYYKFWPSRFLKMVLLYCWSPVCFLLFIAPKIVFIMERSQRLIYLSHTSIYVNKPLTILTKKFLYVRLGSKWPLPGICRKS